MDIFGYLEVIDKEKGWVILDELPIPEERNYAIFNLLFGIKRSLFVKFPVSSFRGVPTYKKEKLEEREEKFDKMDYHSHTWLNVKDLVEYDFDLLAINVLEGSTWKSFIEKMKELAKSYGNDGVRVVVWFDVG